ncbi:MAG TPA: glycosyltransferase family 4 protein, partial [Steroidobacteraceae bacterium]|nr:glycosyltransferase family 4 protein [Steroidobacteraceae bacterium]
FGHNRLFESMGWDIVPFAMQHAENLATPWSEYFVEELEMSGAYSVAQKLARLPKVIYSFEARRRLDALLRVKRPDIAHAHNIYHHISPSILGLLKRRGIPTALTLHDLKLACPAYSMLAHDGVCERCRGGRIHNVVLNRCIGNSAAMSFVVMLEAMLHRLLGSYSRCVDALIVPSRFYLEKFVEWGLPRSHFRYVPNFIDVQRYEPAYTAGRGFAYLGRLTRQKGVATLIRAAAQVRQPLVVAGTGPEMNALRGLAASLNADVTFTGHISGQALHDVVRAARAVVLPSEWYENAPVSLLEAYALGKPVIGARIGGIPELIRENQTGVCFGSGDTVSLAAALEDLHSRPDGEIEDMGRAARRWLEDEFTLKHYRQRIVAVYRELGVNLPASAAFAAESSQPV